jgi:1,4-alpha-glucan branching enzyme
MGSKIIPVKGSSGKVTTFVYDKKPEAKEVFVAGDFNGWNPKADQLLKKKGRFSGTVTLPPGKHQYKFIVDGEWITDPLAQQQVLNQYGTQNSVVNVTGN